MSTSARPPIGGSSRSIRERGLIFVPFGQPAPQYYGGGAARTESVFVFDRRARRRHRKAALVFPDHASRHVGSRRRSRARADRRRAERQEDSGRSRRFQSFADVFPESRNRQVDLSGGRAPGSAKRRAGRAVFAHAALPAEASAARAPRHEARRGFHRRAGARKILPRLGRENRRHSQSRPVHALQQQGISRDFFRPAGRAKLRRRRRWIRRSTTSSSIRATSRASAGSTNRTTAIWWPIAAPRRCPAAARSIRASGIQTIRCRASSRRGRI